MPQKCRGDLRFTELSPAKGKRPRGRLERFSQPGSFNGETDRVDKDVTDTDTAAEG